jgi:outer membrane protein insertion porin family
MRQRSIFRSAVAAVAWLIAGSVSPAEAQETRCPDVKVQPPADSPVLLRCLELRAHPVNETYVETATYLHYIKTQWSATDGSRWAPFKEEALLSDFDSLWRTGFLDDLWIEVIDEPYANGVGGKHAIIHIEERSRVKNVDYSGPDGERLKVDISKIEETLRERNINVRIDSFVDDATLRRVKSVIQELYSEKGYAYPEINTVMEPLPAGEKLINLTFLVNPGPKVQIREIVFEGNEAFSDRKLRGRLKENKPKGWLSFITSGGTYYEAKFADDAELVQDFYNNEGYTQARIGSPQVEVLEDSKDGDERWIRLTIPVDEGQRYRIGNFNIEGNTALKTEGIRPMFKIEEGDYYSIQKIRKGFEKVQEVYGMLGFYQFAPDLRLSFRGIDPKTGEPVGPEPPPPIVDVTVVMVEGKQFFVNRITFTGNSTTHDNVIRREMRVWEGGIFNSTALKESIRRLNQLGYFQPLEGTGEEIQITPTPGKENSVDVKLKFQEQNRNQLSFGAGVSQFDGFFGQLSFQTSNFLGRGETFGVSLQKGSQARQYQVSFSEPYLFDRPITIGTDVFARQFIFPLQFTQDTVGGNFVVGLPLADYTRLYTGYSYEQIKVLDVNPLYLGTTNPILKESLLLDLGGRRTVSKISPSLVFNTVNLPIFPTDGERLTASFDLAGLGGNTFYWQSRLEGIFYHPLNNRLSIGLRAESQYVRPYGRTETLPIFEKFFLGGEYSVRGFDIRSIGPRDPVSRLVTGGNKTLLFNGEFYINIAGPVRALFFYDAGQVRDLGESFVWNEEITELRQPDLPLLYDPFVPRFLVPPGTSTEREVVVIGRTPAFKTSTGVELRFFMPVLNVPFRLIAAYNPQRFGVLNNNLLRTPRFTFRFAVGTTF